MSTWTLYGMLSASTWRVLGLSVALGYAGLGSFAILKPADAAVSLGLAPSKAKLENDTTTQDSIATSMLMLGARDLSIGAALLTFHTKRMPYSMGVVILGGMILCAVDVALVWVLRGPFWGSLFAAGAGIWGVIGAAMVGA